jgi:hypothetical protein
MLIRLLVVALALIIASLFLRLSRRLSGAPPWLRILHQVTFYGALAYAATFAAAFVALHLFGYQL